jgi:hypothetical protein
MAGDVTGASDIYQPSSASASALAMQGMMTDSNLIAAASAGAGTGDNSNAVALANLANQTIVSGITPTNFYAQFVSALGSTVYAVQAQNTECLGHTTTII